MIIVQANDLAVRDTAFFVGGSAVEPSVNTVPDLIFLKIEAISALAREHSRKLPDRGTLVVSCRSGVQRKDATKGRVALSSPPSHRESGD